MIPKPIGALTVDDLDALVAAPRIEDRQLDYKLDLPGGSDDDKREFLADVVAFANAAGGDLVFGVEEQNGAPIAIRGVEVSNFDELRLRLQNVIREATDPKILAVDIVAVGSFERGPAVVVRVEQSWQAPHMVSYKRWSRFFVRDAGQRHQMDANELRAAFTGGEASTQRMQTFRDQRVAAIASGSTPVRIFPHAAAVIHILPVGPAFSTTALDPRVAQPHVVKLLTSDFVCSGNVFFNLDGLLIYSGRERNVATDAYIQVFRNGGIEAASTISVIEAPPEALYGGSTEKSIVQFVRSVGDFRQAVGLSAPVMVAIALIKVANIPLLASRPVLSQSRRFDRDILLLPETVFAEFGDVPRALRLIFDTMWQGAGWTGSPYYDEAGNWTPPK